MVPNAPLWNAGLVGTALQIAESTASPLRVLAGPGTGKTYAMKRRVMRLLEEGVIPRRIFACTFTRTAADDIATAIASLEVPGADQVRTGTLHGFCFSTLSRAEVLETTGRSPRPMADFETRFLIQDLREFGGIRERQTRLEAFGAAWARLQTDAPGWPTDPTDRAFQTALHRWLRFHEGMLITEMVTITLDYLRNNPLCAERSAFDYVLVDEFQDLNRAEQEVIELLATEAALTIIGDEDQSIYSFKYAHPDGIRTVPDRFPDTQDETLDTCRRCPTLVVALANHLISHNTSASGRVLHPYADNGAGDIHIVQWPSLQEEANGIAEFVLRRITAGEVTAGEVLILAPRRHIGYEIRDALGQLDVVAHSFFNEQALDGNPHDLADSEAQQAFTLISLLAYPEDRVALRCWCGFGSGSLGEPGWRRIRERCESTGESPREVLESLREGTLVLRYTEAILVRYALLLERLAALAPLNSYELVDALLPPDAEWAEPLRTPIESKFAADAGFTALQVFETVRSAITQPELPSEVEFVRVMSLHKSKGLTAKLVIVAGCLEGLIPALDFELPLDEQNALLEEQRRLFYVALTRTKHTMVLSSVTHLPANVAYRMGARVVGRGGYVVRVQPSRFLSELGPDAPQPVAGASLLED